MYSTLSAKTHMYPYTSRPKLLYHGNYCDFMLSIVQASYRLLFAARLPVVSTTSVTRRSQTHSRKPSKSTLTHDAVAAAEVSHNHHSIIRVGSDLIQIAYDSHLKFVHGVHSSENSYFTVFCAFLED